LLFPILQILKFSTPLINLKWLIMIFNTIISFIFEFQNYNNFIHLFKGLMIGL